jgi:hypothetical protein
MSRASRHLSESWMHYEVRFQDPSPHSVHFSALLDSVYYALSSGGYAAHFSRVLTRGNSVLEREWVYLPWALRRSSCWPAWELADVASSEGSRERWDWRPGFEGMPEEGGAWA